jgi:hypothetical protein
VMQPTTHMKRPLSSERMSKINSALAQVGGVIAEMRHDADSSGQHHQRTSVLKRACALLDPSIELNTYYRYRVLHRTYHFGEVRDWLNYLTSLETGRSQSNGAEE